MTKAFFVRSTEDCLSGNGEVILAGMHAEPTKLDCVVCGSCVVDVLVRPVPLDEPIGAGKLIRTEPLELTTCGIVSNSGITRARLGRRVDAFTYVGKDSCA